MVSISRNYLERNDGGVIWKNICFGLMQKNKIVSFHEEAGYEKVEFSVHDFFLNYILSASTTGYRFQ